MIKKSLFLACSLLATSAWAIDSSSWTCSSPGTDSCGNLTADGVVVDAPVANSTGYAWVSTNGAPAFDPAALPGGVPQDLVINGATFTSEPFAVASPNAPISFHFNYVTSDGEDFGDYAWARLLDSANNQVALLFTAREHIQPSRWSQAWVCHPTKPPLRRPLYQSAAQSQSGLR